MMKSELFALVASLSFFIIGLDNATVDFGWELLMKNMKISDSHMILLVVLGNIVTALSSLVAGATANYYGRKKPFAAMGVMLLLGSLVKGCAASSYAVLLTGHILTAFGVGFSFTITSIYIAELVPGPSRGYFLAIMQVLFNTGSMAAYILHYIISSSLPEKVAHTTIFVIAALLSFGLTVVILAMPESPYWLLMNGNQLEKAREILENSKRSRTETDQIIAAMEVINNGNDNPPPPGLLAKLTYCLALVWNKDFLHESPLRRVLFSVLGLHILRQLFGVNVFRADILSVFHVFTTKSKLFFANGGVLLVRLVLSIVSGLVVDKRGRRFLLFVGIGSLCCFLFMSGLFLLGLRHNWFHVSSGVIGGVYLFGLLGISGSFDVGLGSVTWVYTAESFDYKLRAQGASYAVVINRVFDIIRVVSFFYLDRIISVGGVSLISVGFMAGGLIFCYKFVIDKSREILK
ncbi:Probable polyol transporter 6 [Linum grandiflorum]